MTLIRFLLLNAIGGFMLGLVAGIAFIQAQMGLDLLIREPLAAGMLLWGFGASIAMGAIGTGLMMSSDD